MNRLENDAVNTVLLSFFRFGDRVVLFSCISKYWQQFIIKSLAYESLRPYALRSWMALLPNITMCTTLMTYLDNKYQYDKHMFVQAMVLFAVKYQYIEKLEWVLTTFQFDFVDVKMIYMLLNYLVKHAHSTTIQSRVRNLRDEFYSRLIRSARKLTDFILVQVCAQGDVETLSSLLSFRESSKEIGRVKNNASLRAALMSNNVEVIELACNFKTRLSPNLDLFDKALSMCNPAASSEVLYYVLHRNKILFQKFSEDRTTIEKTFERAFIAGQVAFCIYLNDEFHLPLKKILFENEVAKRSATQSIAWMLTLNLFPHLVRNLSTIMEHALYKQRWDVMDLLFAHFPFQTIAWNTVSTQIDITQIVITISDYEWWYARFPKSFSPTMDHVLDILSSSPFATKQQVEQLFLANADDDSWSCISVMLYRKDLINYPIMHLTWLYLSRSEILFQRLHENIDEIEFIQLVGKIGHIPMMNEILQRTQFQEALKKYMMNEPCWWFSTHSCEMILCITSHCNPDDLVLQDIIFASFYHWPVIKVEAQTDPYGNITDLGNENIWNLVCAEESCYSWVAKLRASRKSKLDQL